MLYCLRMTNNLRAYEVTLTAVMLHTVLTSQIMMATKSLTTETVTK